MNPSALALPALACLAVAAWADEVPSSSALIDAAIAVEESRGLYGDRVPTRIRSTSFITRYRAKRWSAEVELPWLEVRTEGGGAGLPSSVGSGSSSHERGLGDAWIRLSYEVREFTQASTGIDLTLKVKTKTGNVRRGLGSGDTDLAAQVEWTQAWGPVQGFGQLGFRRTGDADGFRPYRDPWYGEIGGLIPVTPALETGAYYTGREALGRLGPLKELTLYGAWRGGSERFQLHLTRGFARASPDWALGLTVRHRF